MKIQLASDLHLEFLEKRFPGERIIEPAPGADLLVLAGDIHNGTKAVAAFADWPVPVLYLAGPASMSFTVSAGNRAVLTPEAPARVPARCQEKASSFKV